MSLVFCLSSQHQQQPAKAFNFDTSVPEAAVDPALLNWTFLDETCIPEFDASAIFTSMNEQVPVTTEAPVFFSAPSDPVMNPVIAETQYGWANNMGSEPTFVPSFSAGLPPKPPTLTVKQEQNGNNSGASSPSFEMYGESGHSTDGDNKSEQLRKEKSKGKAKASVDQLPKELANHPCAATLLSAGIRIKGRSQDELIQVAERIKKRRRASAARCRARRASHIHVLEDENEELKEENAALKRRIAELTGGNMDLAKLLGTDAASLQAIPDLEQCAY
eukprot:CAMPEP_0177779510 /NCGR_PEP_ID=MMETSP0491_2-20121128/16628_1 /TAXON_ID=63592 /ORGANISM="Tetraselmis chuii, Strain PLY429" /LENGTH=275 /DNA_ID=CAMNT_0019299059 /DNA_START=772 /DNA_END=1599 /DNA_ORIENTATION=-